MNLSYKYSLLNIDGDESLLMLVAPNYAFAKEQIDKLVGEKGQNLKLSPVETFKGWFLGCDVNQSELATLYYTLYHRLSIGQPINETLDEAILFISDPRLRHQVAVLKTLVQNGNSLSAGMEKANFPRMHQKILSAVEASGRVPETFLTLSKELQRNEALKTTIAQLLYTPVITLVLSYIFVWVVIAIFSPSMFKQFLNLGIQIEQTTPLIRYYFTFVRLFQEHQPLSSFTYLLAGIGVLLFAKSKLFKDWITSFGSFQQLAERMDSARSWGAFGQLFDAGLDIHKSCQMISEACVLDKNKTAFLLLKKKLMDGVQLPLAVKQAGFPNFVTRVVRSAGKTDLINVLSRFVQQMELEIEALSKKIGKQIEVALLFLIALVVLFTATVSYFPTLILVLQKINT